MEENNTVVMANQEATTEEQPSKWARFKAKVKKPAIIAGSLLALKIAYDKGKHRGYVDGYDEGYDDGETNAKHEPEDVDDDELEEE